MVALYWILMILFLFMSGILILIVLIQKGRGGGLSGAFGGAGGNTAFGSKTGDVLTWVTSVVFGIFLLLAIAMNLTANAVQNQLTPSSANGVIDVTGAPGSAPTNTPPGK